MPGRVLAFSLLFIIAVGGMSRRPAAELQRTSNHIPADAMIRLNREGLIVTVVADGRVTVEGQTFDLDIGAIRMRMSPKELRSSIEGFDRIDFFGFNNKYRDEADGCSVHRMAEVGIMQTTSFTANGQSKSVTRYPYECLEKDGSPYPRQLVALEHQLETMLNLHKR
jgi:hypothetical protein